MVGQGFAQLLQANKYFMLAVAEALARQVLMLSPQALAEVVVVVEETVMKLAQLIQVVEQAELKIFQLDKEVVMLVEAE
jgi:hypothetical protein